MNFKLFALVISLPFLISKTGFGAAALENKFLQIEGPSSMAVKTQFPIFQIRMGQSGDVILSVNRPHSSEKPTKLEYILHFLSPEDAKRFKTQLESSTHQVIIRVNERDILTGTISSPSSLFAWDIKIEEKDPVCSLITLPFSNRYTSQP